jgi:diguanylate cyclase (GGDEF)-like protein
VPVITTMSRRLFSVVVTRVRGWALWSLPVAARGYVVGVPLLAAAGLAVAAARTQWRIEQAGVFLLLLACAAAMLEATRDVNFPQGTLTRDVQGVWYLAVAVLLPPAYALIAPIPLVAMKQWRLQRGVLHRRVFSIGAIGLGYGAASLEFHGLLAPLAGGVHAATAHPAAMLGVILCVDVTGRFANEWLIVTAVKLTDHKSRVRALMFSRGAAVHDWTATCLAALVAFALTITLLALVIALPVVLMQKRFLMHAQLTAEARMDAKTGLLNAAAWQREVTAELSRTSRFVPPPSVAIIDIDHFKQVNDNHGHLAGDRVLRAIAERLKAQLRDGDVIGRFGGEEFAVLLPRTGTTEARRVAERLRARIDDEPVAIGDGRSDGVLIHVTISIGVAEPGPDGQGLEDLLAAADAAMYQAKHAGRNLVKVLRPLQGSAPAPARDAVPVRETVTQQREEPGQAARAAQ